jgi:hypothetical protein
MPTPRCFYEVQSRLYAILNWRARQGPEDVLCLMELNPAQAVEFRRLKAEGRPDPEVYESIFPPRPKPPRPPGLDTSGLSKQQLADILRALTGSPLPSIGESTRPDLEILCRFLFRFVEVAP